MMASARLKPRTNIAHVREGTKRLSCKRHSAGKGHVARAPIKRSVPSGTKAIVDAKRERVTTAVIGNALLRAVQH
jgi:hypothetical protein